ncbi:hypothetical protein Q765_06665 [Flavobacterium rivuli WB 3.3-2 = DSM 21788]|uniref:DUF4348 domain-containing protein n=1 Tax=Flavobacterium rivuli WB 3.3-2 = DSM 21788 TaxID=1121895 RepID=A0A0A2M7A4_9FLAO|nr:hypothetical protein [Flavobacterium rivuli]KGO87343.1 hypothetical protein Q765_06665 [Flavobacterium rivuli WB 3.3-2 = DSM 21788]
MNYKFFLLLLFFKIIIGCNNVEKKERIENKSIEKSLTIKVPKEDFDEFFTKFRSDSIFKFTRIKFPLKGFNSDEMGTGSEQSIYLWDKENFIFYSVEDFKNQTTTDIIKEDIIKSDSVVTYRRYKEDSGYDINYEFKNIKDKWYLIYYSYSIF